MEQANDFVALLVVGYVNTAAPRFLIDNRHQPANGQQQQSFTDTLSPHAPLNSSGKYCASQEAERSLAALVGSDSEYFFGSESVSRNLLLMAEK